MKNVLLCLILCCTTSLFANVIPSSESNNTSIIDPPFTVNDITYTPISSTEASVTGHTIATPSNIIIPSTVTYGVTTYTVTSIGINAFKNCTNLTSITLPNSLISIGDYAFRACAGLTSITIPSGVTSIGNTAFYNCTSLTSITLPNTLTSIGPSAFNGCSGIQSITIPSGVISIGNTAFQNCTSLTSITIPDGVTTIGSYVFTSCTSLTSITIPNSVTSIGTNAFQNCLSLTSITLPYSLTNIGTFTFGGCTGLTSITLPSSLTSISANAFIGCTNLTSITLPNSVTSIGPYTFNGCTNLTSITLPNSLTSIANYTFYNCTSLTSITLPNSLTSIGASTFENCTGLTSITIPSGVSAIGPAAFQSCSSLSSFTINVTNPPSFPPGFFVFYNVTVASVKLYVPAGSLTDYRNASIWSGFKFVPIITGPGASTASTSSLSMNENSTAVTTFTADEVVTWSLVTSNDSALFSIDGSSGALVFTNAPDYETPLSQLNNNTYVVEIKATGTVSGLISTQQLTITVANLVETPAVLSNFNSFTLSAGTSDFTINAPTSNSIGAITYTSSNTAVATITGTRVHLVGPGTTTITATQAANGSYLGNTISTTMRVSALCGNWGYYLTYPPVTVP